MTAHYGLTALPNPPKKKPRQRWRGFPFPRDAKLLLRRLNLYCWNLDRGGVLLHFHLRDRHLCSVGADIDRRSVNRVRLRSNDRLLNLILALSRLLASRDRYSDQHGRNYCKLAHETPPSRSVFAGWSGNIASDTQSSNASRCIFRTRRSSYTCATSPPMMKMNEA